MFALRALLVSYWRWVNYAAESTNTTFSCKNATMIFYKNAGACTRCIARLTNFRIVSDTWQLGGIPQKCATSVDNPAVSKSRLAMGKTSFKREQSSVFAYLVDLSILNQSRRHGGLIPLNKAPSPPNGIMKHYESVKFQPNFRMPMHSWTSVKPPLLKTFWRQFCIGGIPKFNCA